MFLRCVLDSPRFAQGGDARDRLFAAVSPEARAVLEAPIFPSSWYDERVSVEVVRAAAPLLGLQGDEAIQAYFRLLQVPSLGRVYRVILSMMSPETIARRAAWFWRRNHDSGEMVIDSVEGGVARARVLGSPTVADPVYSLAVAGGIEGLLALTGVVPVAARRWIEGPEAARFELRWGDAARPPPAAVKAP